jgi:hydroxypyruvate reductase
MSAKRRLLQLGPLPPGLGKMIHEEYAVEELWKRADRDAFVAGCAGAFDGAVTMSRHGCPADVFASLAGGGKRAVVACFGVGFDGIDLDAAKRYGVAVSTTPDVLTDCVADLAFGLILASARKMVAADRFVQRGDWKKGGFPLACRVSGKRLGIVGLGRIGQAIARRSAGFDMTVRYHGRQARSGVPYQFEGDLIALAAWADFLVLACPGGEETRHLISDAALTALGPKGFLINIARGSVVDEAALAAALTEGRIAGAGLDVLADEPNVPAALLGNDRVVLMPHIAAATEDTRSAMEQLVMDNLASFFSSGKVLTPPG